MTIMVSVDDAVVDKAQKRAEELGTSIDQLLREYIEQLVEPGDPQSDADEFVRLSRLSNGDSNGWKFNREEIHERR